MAALFCRETAHTPPQQNVGRPNEWDTFQVWMNRPVRLFHFNLLYSKGICWTCWLATSPPCWVRHVPDGGFLGSLLLILLPRFRGLSCLPEFLFIPELHWSAVRNFHSCLWHERLPGIDSPPLSYKRREHYLPLPQRVQISRLIMLLSLVSKFIFCLHGGFSGCTRWWVS